jgi:hypothetical protein
VRHGRRAVRRRRPAPRAADCRLRPLQQTTGGPG